MGKPKKDVESLVVHVRMDAPLKTKLEDVMTAEARPSLNNTIVKLLLEALQEREASPK